MSLYESLMERMDGREYSNYFSAFCPFDTHKTPALLVYDDGMAKCLSCNKIWSHDQLNRKIGSHFIPQKRDTVSQILPRWRRWEEKYGDLDGIAQAAHRSLLANPPFQTYFRMRKIYDVVDEGNLGYLDGWITFPVFDSRNSICNIVVRSTSNRSDIRYVVSPGVVGTSPLYVPSWKRVLASDTVFVVYGIVDAISMHLAGLPAVTGTTGKSLSAELLSPLRKRFTIVPDANEEPEAHKLANKLGWRAKVKRIDWMDGCKDTDDIRRKFGNSALLQALGA